jgi:3-deoxy-7-phosphoheptulonate synthase
LLHDNSCKQYQLQPLVAKDITQQIVEGNQSIMGIMPKSHLFEGNQSIPENLDKLKYAVSVTDACINWKDTERLLKNMANHLAAHLKKRLSNALAYVQK